LCAVLRSSRFPRRPGTIAKAEIRRLKTQLARATARIEELQAAAETDFLLGISTGAASNASSGAAISFIQRYHASGALIVLDVDRLKPINDKFGHAAGDEVLKAVVAVLSRQIRSSDVIGRLGGDEFALLLWNLSETDAHAKAAALEEDYRSPQFCLRWRQRSATGVSAGVSLSGRIRRPGGRWPMPIARCMCARRSDATKPDTNISINEPSSIMTKPVAVHASRRRCGYRRSQGTAWRGRAFRIPRPARL